MNTFVSCFPEKQNKRECYFDSAATSYKLNSSLQAMQDYYTQYNANVHRGQYPSAREATDNYEAARDTVANFVNSSNSANIIFTSGATEAINIVANGLQLSDLDGKEILICESEHHANLFPWQVFAKQYGFLLKIIKLGENGTFSQKNLKNALLAINQNTALLAIAHASNVLGNVYPVKELCAKAATTKTLTLIDGTQAAPHITIDVQDLACDFYVISGHKMYASTGIGALYGKAKWLEKLMPSKFGGDMIASLTWDNYELLEPPLKFEGGTPNIAGALAMAQACIFIKDKLQSIQKYETELMNYLLEKLDQLNRRNKLNIIGNCASFDAGKKLSIQDSIPLLSFYSDNLHASDIAIYLANKNIASRAGHHCAMPLMQGLGIKGCVRISIACYNTKADVDNLVEALEDLFDESADNLNTERLSTETLQKAPLQRNKSIEDMLRQASTWTQKHRLLLINSKHLKILSADKRDENTFVQGCEASVWLALYKLPNSSHRQFLAYSDSKVIRGLLFLMINFTEKQLKANNLGGDPASHFSDLLKKHLQELGLTQYFSQGRRDGVNQVIKSISKLLHIL